jgi:BirA family biotin operon repressor/biotin-[acetyl-CoA-carboxylase] ligase
VRFSSIRRVERTGSTNDDVAKILGEPESRGLTLVAEYQTHGSGRKGRRWIAPPASALLFTTALPDPISPRHLWAVPFWIGLAVQTALKSFDVTAELQWPNDLLLDGKKVAGILCISRVSGDEAWAACGVGINVLRPGDGEAMREIIPPPAFLSDMRWIDRDELLAAILEAADQSYDTLRAPELVARAWEKAAHIPGMRYRLALDGSNETLEAEALGLGAAGELIVDHRGTRRSVAQADARVLR